MQAREIELIMKGIPRQSRVNEGEIIYDMKKVGELVRCKDCEYWQDNNGGYPHEECRWGKDETPDPDDYCSFGRRKR